MLQLKNLVILKFDMKVLNIIVMWYQKLINRDVALLNKSKYHIYVIIQDVSIQHILFFNPNELIKLDGAVKII